MIELARRSALSTGGCIALTALVLLAIFFAPKRDIVNCVSTARLGAGATLSLNCDSRHITRDTREIDRYLVKQSPSRSRPMHIVVVGALTHALSPVLVPASAVLAKVLPQVGKAALPSYLAAIVFNALVLALAVVALVRATGADADRRLIAALAVFAASYDVTVAWFWVPHQIVMNTLVPVGGVVAYMIGRGADRLALPAMVVLGLATAAACLTYGYCLIWPVAFELGLGVAVLRGGGGTLRPAFERAVVYGIDVCLPLVLWFGAYAVMGAEFAYEAQGFGQFKWLGEAVRSGTLASAVPQHLGVLARTAARYAGWLGMLLAATVAALLALAARRGALRSVAGDPALQGCLLVLLLMLTFNFLQGYHQGRLLYFPVMLLTIAVVRLLHLSGESERRLWFLGALSLTQLVRMFLAVPTTME